MKQACILIMMVLANLCACSRSDHQTAWMEFSRDRNGTCFYTLEKISRDESSHLVKVWVKTLFNEIRHQGDDEVAYAKNLFMIRCTEKTYRINTGFFYNPGNKIVSRTDEDESREITMLMGKTDSREAGKQPEIVDVNTYSSIIPGSAVDHLREKVCR